MLARLVDDAERRILRRDQLADAVDDQLQDQLDVQEAADATDSGVERLEHRRKARTIRTCLGVVRHPDRLAPRQLAQATPPGLLLPDH